MNLKFVKMKQKNQQFVFKTFNHFHECSNYSNRLAHSIQNQSFYYQIYRENKSFMDKKIILFLIALITSYYVYEFSQDKENPTMRSRFQIWKKEFGKTFSQSEQEYRFQVFIQNWIEVEKHNANPDSTYEKGINQFSAMTHSEWASKYLDYVSVQEPLVMSQDDKNTPILGDIDWVDKGMVTPVKDQGDCHASYAFSSVAALQSAQAIRNNMHDSLSVQQIVDCTQNTGNRGCQTGFIMNSLQYVWAHGISTQSNYKWVGYASSCRTQGGSYKFDEPLTVRGCTNMINVMYNQPIAVGVDANNMKDYKGKIFSNCGTNLSIAMELVSISTKYWKLKASWGTAWGEEGYIRISSNANTCGVCQDGYYPKFFREI